MGYAPSYFSAHVAKWLRERWLRRDSKIIEFGAQEFSGDIRESRQDIAHFLRSHGVEEACINEIADPNRPLLVSEIYRSLGVEYTAIDVDGAFGSLFFDLNSGRPPDEWRGAFHFVNNEGTIEHLINPINGFQVAHELLEVGGVARHSMPLTGWVNHGFFYPTPKFYGTLIGANNYELLEAEAQLLFRPLDLVDTRFRIIDEIGREIDQGGATIADAWILLTYRKSRDADFAIPLDHIYSDVSDAKDQRRDVCERLDKAFINYTKHRKPQRDA